MLRDLFRTGEQFEEASAIIDRQIGVLRQLGAAVAERLTTGIDLVGLMPTLRVNSDELQTRLMRACGDGVPAVRSTHSQRSSHPEEYLKGTDLETRFNETLKAGRIRTRST